MTSKDLCPHEQFVILNVNFIEEKFPTFIYLFQCILCELKFTVRDLRPNLWN